jgi:hypothetical protein
VADRAKLNLCLTSLTRLRNKLTVSSQFESAEDTQYMTMFSTYWYCGVEVESWRRILFIFWDESGQGGYGGTCIGIVETISGATDLIMQ